MRMLAYNSCEKRFYSALVLVLLTNTYSGRSQREKQEEVVTEGDDSETFWFCFPLTTLNTMFKSH